MSCRLRSFWLRMEPAIRLPELAFPAFSLTAAFLLFLLPNPELPSPHFPLHECGVLSGSQYNTPAFGIFTMDEGFHDYSYAMPSGLARIPGPLRRNPSLTGMSGARKKQVAVGFGRP